MRALKFYQTGSLDDLHVEEVTVPIPAEGEVLVEVKAAAINPSDIKNVQGKMHETTVPRIPGRDFAGMIVKGPDERLGQSVFGSGGNLGFGRDGSHAQYLAVPATAVLPLSCFWNRAGVKLLCTAYLLGILGDERLNLTSLFKPSTSAGDVSKPTNFLLPARLFCLSASKTVNRLIYSRA